MTDAHPFLASPERAALPLPDATVAHIVGLFDHLAQTGIGRAPRDLDGAGAHALLGHLLPAHLARRDPLAEHVPAVLRAYIAHLAATGPVPHHVDLRRGLEATMEEFQATVRTGENRHHHHHHHAPVQPFVREQPKVGRNDDCLCGSGKKYKKCHGKAG